MSGLYGSMLGKNCNTLVTYFRHRFTGSLIMNVEILKQRHRYPSFSTCFTCGYHTQATTNTTSSDDIRVKLNPKFWNFSCLQICRLRICTYCNQTHRHSTILWHSYRLNNNKSENVAPILRSHFSQLHGQESTSVGEIPVASKIKPLSAKEIKPLLNPEEKSKVEETCETLKAKQQAETLKTFLEAVDEAYVKPKKTEPEPVKKTLVQRIVHEVKHYANGFRLLFINIRISFKQLWKVLNGQELSRRERKLIPFRWLYLSNGKLI